MTDGPYAVTSVLAVRAVIRRGRSASLSQNITLLPNGYFEKNGITNSSVWVFQIKDGNFHGASDSGHPPVVAGECDRLTIVGQEGT